jgi:hypothetical protein
MASQRAFRGVALLFDNFFLVSWIIKLSSLFFIGNLDSVDGVAVSVLSLYGSGLGSGSYFSSYTGLRY